MGGRALRRTKAFLVYIVMHGHMYKIPEFAQMYKTEIPRPVYVLSFGINLRLYIDYTNRVESTFATDRNRLIRSVYAMFIHRLRRRNPLNSKISEGSRAPGSVQEIIALSHGITAYAYASLHLIARFPHVLLLRYVTLLQRRNPLFQRSNVCALFRTRRHLYVIRKHPVNL